MYLVIAFISKVEKVQQLINTMKEHGFTGGTLFDGVGMRRVMPKILDMPMVASLHTIFDQKGEINKVLFSVVKDMDEVNQLNDIIEEVIGDLHQQNTGLVISLKLETVKGFDRWEKPQ